MVVYEISRKEEGLLYRGKLRVSTTKGQGCVLFRVSQKQSDYVTLLLDKTQIFRTSIKLRVTISRAEMTSVSVRCGVHCAVKCSDDYGEPALSL